MGDNGPMNQASVCVHLVITRLPPPPPPGGARGGARCELPKKFVSG